jgi:mitochondrial fission protein ELM1
MYSSLVATGRYAFICGIILFLQACNKQPDAIERALNDPYTGSASLAALQQHTQQLTYDDCMQKTREEPPHFVKPQQIPELCNCVSNNFAPNKEELISVSKRQPPAQLASEVHRYLSCLPHEVFGRETTYHNPDPRAASKSQHSSRTGDSISKSCERTSL